MDELRDVGRFDDEVLRCLHEVAAAARQVPAEYQTKRLQDALTSLVELDILAVGMFSPPAIPRSPHAPGAPLSS
jgi:hypothetical protein